ncbi:MAG: hypothetical protein R3C30_14390 [Hyphomonadaceae bacterium]
MATVQLSHDYPLSAAELFARIVRYDELTEAMRNIATYQGMPDGEAHFGQKFTVNVKLRGWLPTPPWTIEVVRRDDAARVLASIERGGPVKRWAHTITIQDKPGGGSTMRDVIAIDAGLLTGFYVGQARAMYEARHAARRKLLGIEGGQTL